MMQMLSAGGMRILTDQKRAADEDNPRGYWEFEAVKNTRNCCEWLQQARGAAVKMVHLLLLDLPREGYFYRVLLMKRRMAEVLASQRVMLRRQGKPGAALSNEELGRAFLAQMARVEDWLKAQSQFAVLTVDFNELVANPEPQVKAISEFLGRALDSEKMIRAVDARLYRQRTSSEGLSPSTVLPGLRPTR